MEASKLDFGGGDGYRGLMRHGFLAVDVQRADIFHDMRQFPYPMADNSAALIHCSHTLEHLRKEDGRKCLQEFFRILKPGGILTLAVPDMDVFIDAHLSGDWSMHPPGLEKDLNRCAAGGQFPADDPRSHKYMYCWESLAYMLEKIGFIDIVRHGHNDGPHKHLFPDAYNPDFSSSSLYIDTVKPTG
jgi:predicted SAM-dependent methyltransferase